MLEEVSVTCPACWQTVTLDVDPTAGEVQVYTEDCPVCCRPMAVRVTVGEDAGGCVVEVAPESD